MLKKIITSTLLLALTVLCWAQPKELSLEDIYKNGTYAPRGITALRWSDDGKSFYTLQRNEEVGGLDIVLNDIATGNKSVAISATQLIPQGEEKPLIVENYIWSPDKSKLLIYTNSKRVWRLNTKGDYYVLDITTGDITKLGKGLEPSEMMFAKFSPDGEKVAYVYKNNIYVENFHGNHTHRHQLTFDGSDIIINGNFDWVYEEELHQHDGFRWSPDSQQIAYWQFDTEGTGTFYMINNIDSVYSELIPLPYPKAGTPNSAARVGVVDISHNPQTRWFDIPGDPRNNYIARIDFVPGTDELMIQQLNRLQNTNSVYYGNTHTMELNNFFTEKDEAFLDIHDYIHWGKDNKFFTWTSERDGWRHLYKVSKDGSKIEPVTAGEFDVVEVVNVDMKNGYVYYIASPESPLERYLFRTKMNGKCKAERLTPVGEIGHHSYNIAPNSKYAIHTFSNSETPARYELVSLPDHKVIKVMQDNQKVAENYAALQVPAKEFFRVDIGEIVLDGWMIKPTDFDETKQYPVIFYIYGEPWTSTVQNKWGGNNDLWSRYLAQEGYIVMSVDPRGVNTPRGRHWRKCVYGKVGIIPPDDHAKAVQKIIETYSFVDGSRIGIWGWSGGGSSTAHLMFKYPDIYSTGIAVAGVYSQYLYDTIYQERYMGLPSTNPEGYYNGSPINFAANLKGNLMLIHGTGDDNVHYQSMEMLVNELIKQNKIFSMLSYPMRAHGIYERENTTYHLYQSMLKYWLENLPAGGR